MANFIWDVNQVNYVEPSSDLFENGYADDAIPTSGNTNWLYYNFSANRIPVGQVSFFFNPGFIDGFLDCIGETMGSAASGATYPSDSYQDLFTVLWTYNSYCVVAPGGRGASALADWNANKTITLPNLQGCTFAGVSTAASIFNTGIGAIVGQEDVTLTISNMPEIQPVLNDPGHGHDMRFWQNVNNGGRAWGDETPGVDQSEPNLQTYVGNNDSAGGVLHNATGITISPLGGGQAHSNVQPSMVGRFKIKT